MLTDHRYRVRTHGQLLGCPCSKDRIGILMASSLLFCTFVLWNLLISSAPSTDRSFFPTSVKCNWRDGEALVHGHDACNVQSVGRRHLCAVMVSVMPGQLVGMCDSCSISSRVMMLVFDPSTGWGKSLRVYLGSQTLSVKIQCMQLYLRGTHTHTHTVCALA